MIDNRLVGRRIAVLRQQKRMTQQQLAAMMNVSHQAVSKWESGQALPDIQTLLELTRFFGVTIEQLMQSGEENADCGENLKENGEDSFCDAEQKDEKQTSQEAEKMSIQQLLQLAPYMSGETVEKIVMEMDEKLSASQIVRIAPYLKSESIERLIEKHQPEFSWEQVRRIVPFLRREAVDQFVQKVAIDSERGRSGAENINRAINDIGRAFDDIGKGMGHAVKKAIRFGENMFNEVSAAWNDLSTDGKETENASRRSERALSLRRRAFERAAADQNWDWLASHIEETAGDEELRRKIAAAACENGQREWLCRYMGEFADEGSIAAAIQGQNWDWLGENIGSFAANQQEKILMAAAEMENWAWLEAHAPKGIAENIAMEIALRALRAGEISLALRMAEEPLSEGAIARLAQEAYALKQFDALDAWIGLLNVQELERILLDLADHAMWDRIAGYLPAAATELAEKLMEKALEQGDFDAIDLLDPYL